MENYHSTIIGKGEPLIFLPATGFPGIEGLNIAEYLSDTYECHLVDLPGIGKSEGISDKVTVAKIAQWIKVYIDHHQIDQAVFVGHSLGRD
ncbi:alpha/beta fold hydrolase [Gracilibacillus salinarum]|uniref:Alpha/beta hydrolase n=1 Tax=Gracilibacillus salinarum TaxID=2932255 RepID=A0ABY4GLY5_9BACI|nr:alpha/beta fold hydrolase [Gracilibacillus salinarum]UOQ84752.1 alpha/beta hydrolase [Gracilibacillus salinarum]